MCEECLCEECMCEECLCEECMCEGACVRNACVRSTCEWSNDLCVCKLYKKSNNNATKLEDGWENKVDGEP